jgi:SAM-dependent methyltransferase
MESSVQQWNAESYRRNVCFVPELGRTILAWLSPQPGERVLDVGCGDGVLTQEVAASGADVLAIDASPEMVAAARGRGLAVEQADAREIDFHAEFDAVFSNAVLHWILEPELVVDGIFRALKPGGRFVAEFGGFGNIAAIVTAIRAVLRDHGVDDGVPKYFPTVRAYTAVLERCGFTVERCELVPRPTFLPQGMQGWLEALGGGMLNRLKPEQVQPARDQVIDLLRPSLCDDQGNWSADYVRIRVEARKPV